MNQAILAAGTERPAMNETVKAALMDARENERQAIREAHAREERAQQQLEAAQAMAAKHTQRLGSIVAHLVNNGVDVAAEDAKAVQRAASSGCMSTVAGQVLSDMGALGGSYAQQTGQNAVNRRQ